MSISKNMMDDFSDLDFSEFGQSVVDDTLSDDDDFRIPIESIKEIIMLPPFDPSIAKRLKDHDLVEIPEIVAEQLKDFVSAIADLYPDSLPFHNFAHASHVLMSVVKCEYELSQYQKGLWLGHSNPSFNDFSFPP